jgi:hypothetical protein
MQKLQCFKTIDGTLFELEQDAINHEKEYLVENTLNSILYWVKKFAMQIKGNEYVCSEHYKSISVAIYENRHQVLKDLTSILEEEKELTTK